MPKLLRKLVWRVLRASMPLVNRGLSMLETSLAGSRERSLSYAPVLIVGAPRSGSTLLFQLLTEACDFAYLSNLHCFFHGAPSLVERIARPSRRRRPSDYSSRHGEVTGWSSPSECGAFWYRFFRSKPEYVGTADVEPARMKAMRAALRALVDASARPVLFKNLHCSLRLEPTAAALPEALFVFIRRDVVDNAESLLQTRLDVHGSYELWWSMEPPGIERLRNLPAEQQVVEQVRRINALIERDRNRIGRSRFLDVTYEELCADPTAVVDSVRTFLASHGVNVATRAAVSGSFNRRRDSSIDPMLRAAVRDYVDRTREETSR